MFKVFKSKEIIDPNMNNGNTRDILEDFNNYQNNPNNMVTDNNQTFSVAPNNNNINNQTFSVAPNNNNINNQTFSVAPNNNNINNQTFSVPNNNNNMNNQIFNNAQNNNINQQVASNYQPNNNEIKTIDLNQSIIDAKKLREEHEKSYQQRMNNGYGNFENENTVNNTQNDLEYKYNEQIKKYNALDNIKSIIDDSTDTNNNANNLNTNNIDLNTLYSQSMNNSSMLNNQIGIQSTNNISSAIPMLQNQVIAPQPVYNNVPGTMQPNIYNTNIPNQPMYGNQFNQQYFNPAMYQQQMMGQMPVNIQYGTPNIPQNQFVQPNMPMNNNVGMPNYNGQDNTKLLDPNMFEGVENGYKRCPRCGQKLRDDYKQCFVCGTWLN